GETLAAPAFGAGVGVAEYEPLAQALAGEVDFGAVHQRQAGGIDEDADAVLLDHRVAVAPVAGQVGHVAPAGTAGALHAKTQAQRLRVALQEALHALQGDGGEGDGHGKTSGETAPAIIGNGRAGAAAAGGTQQPAAARHPRLPARATATLPPLQMGSMTQGFKP